MQGKKQKPKVRLTRNEDGTIGLPNSSSRKTDDLVRAWYQQNTNQQKPNISVKQQFYEAKAALKNNIKSKKISGNHNKVIIDKPRTITFNIPEISIIKKYIPHTKKQLLISATILVTIFAAMVGVSVKSNNKGSGNELTSGQVQGAIQTKVIPEFATLSPFGKGVDDIGGFAKISPSGAPAVYSFVDTIGSTPVKVSQQQLPDSFRSELSNKLKELAINFNANETLEVGDGVAYIGTSINGAQSIVYAKGENLVLIASDNTIPNSNWVTYIGNLRY